MSPCPLCGCSINSFAISLDAEFVMCSNENCAYPFTEDSKIVRASIIDKRTPEEIANARKRKTQSLASSITKTHIKKQKADGHRNSTPPILSAEPLPESPSITSISSPMSSTAIPSCSAYVLPTTSGIPATPTEQLTLTNLLSVDAVQESAFGLNASSTTSQPNTSSLSDIFSSIPDFDNIMATSTTLPVVLDTTPVTISSKSTIEPANSAVDFATPAPTPISSPTELSKFLSSIPDFDNTASSTSKVTPHLDEFNSLDLDFLHSEPWSPPVTPPNQPLSIDTPTKHASNISTTTLESLLFGNDFEIAFDQEFSTEIEAVLQS
ncbi:hypothetical protein FBU30_005906 [Linnemannia zychae]|nr:hypothetical protein FBU30_005906 [Linnemannia zychae]